MAAMEAELKLDELFGSPLDLVFNHFAKGLEEIKAKYEASAKIELYKVLMEKDDTDLMLLRFLIGKQGNVDVAFAALEKSMAWREAWTPDKAGSNVVDLDDAKFDEAAPFHQEYVKYSPELFFTGTDKKGMPLIYQVKGRMDVMGLLKALTAEQYHQHVAYVLIATMRKLNQMSREQNKFLGFCLVYCGKNASMAIVKYLPYFKYDIDDLQLNCPEALSDCLGVNAPWFFNMLFNMVKPWLDKRTLEKIHILGSTDARLAEYIDKQHIPTVLGGDDPAPKLVIPDPLRGMSKLDIGAGKKHELEILAPASSYSISWKWQPVSKDVGFTAQFIDEEGNEEQVVEYARMQATGEVFQGSFVSSKGGTLKLVWDNSYSYWTGKQVMQWVGEFEHVAQ
eukprot:TRINITY_DN748_c0_g1_i1.p1 TRINITY_DN748_c0_g1~~TRINITY_DN748_c0_g1_i1.p1  ORF type:complete len:394 (-),score=97.32 TRINITY_DN748_c0_g1_i1:53-1234(-)